MLVASEEDDEVRGRLLCSCLEVGLGVGCAGGGEGSLPFWGR